MATAGKPEDAPLAATAEAPVEAEAVSVVDEEKADPAVAVPASEAAPVPSKRAAKKGKKTKPVEEADAENNKNFAATIDHPYLSFLHKRIRLYKKKLEKIRALEAARTNDGKVLNDQQQEVVGNKSLVEKMITEFESLREQFIEVYLKEEDEKKKALAKEEALPVVEKESVATNEQAKQEEEAPVKEEVVTPPAAVELLPRDAFAYVEDLLRTLHAVTLHQALGEDVPPVLDYFSKVVLGTTRPPAEVPFDENLAESLEEATRYLTGSDQIVALQFTYKDLRAMVEQLGVPGSSATEEEVNKAGQEAAESLPVVEAPAAEELPQINFFTDSQLEVEEAPVTEAIVHGAVVTDDKDIVHDASPEAIEPTASEEEEEARDESPVDEAPVVPPVGAAPPKSFADAAAAPAAGKSVWNRKPKSVTTPASGSGDDKPNQRRRSQGRSKSNGNNSNSPRRGDRKTVDGSNGAASASGNGNSQNKPRRPRPQRSNDENSGPSNTNRSTANAGGKHDDRRPRSERPVRKQQPTQYREATAV